MSVEFKIIELSGAIEFENQLNAMAAEGWIARAVSCGFVNSERYNFSGSYQAVMERLKQ